MSQQDRWTIEGRNILSPDRLAAVKRVLNDVGPVIVEHWHYRGSRCPDRMVFDDYDRFLEYLRTQSVPGDAFHVWSFAVLCKDDNTLIDGKYPDEQGRVPLGGAY